MQNLYMSLKLNNVNTSASALYRLVIFNNGCNLIQPQILDEDEDIIYLLLASSSTDQKLQTQKSAVKVGQTC